MLSLREKAGQLVFPRIGSNLPPVVTVAEDLERIEAVMDACPIGGLVLFNSNIGEMPDALITLQRRSVHPLLIGTDMERGVGQQVKGATVFPHAMAYAALGEEAEALLEASARVAAREALASGIHITFAPVADVNRDPRNPIIATRAFGTEPKGAARLVQAYIRGCRAEGLLTTAKHFPGHGNTSEDSHATLPTVHSDRAEMMRTDLVPFRAAIEAGADLIMTAHVSYPAFDPAGTPATLSRPILRGLLREELGFEGVVTSDSLLMAGIKASHDDPGAQAVALLQAGVDLLLDPEDPPAVVDGLVQAVEDGRLEEAVLERAFERVWRLKQSLIERFDEHLFAEPARHFPKEEVGQPTHQQLAEDVARRAVTVLKAAPGTLPIETSPDAEGDLMVLFVKPYRSRLDVPEEPLGHAVRTTLPGAVYAEVGPEWEAKALEQVKARAAAARQVVVAFVVKPSAWHTFGLLPAQEQLVRALVEAGPVVLASLGTPAVLEQFPEAAAHLCTYSDVAASQMALARALVGAAQTTTP